jgi:hypothetical protein
MALGTCAALLLAGSPGAVLSMADLWFDPVALSQS